MTNNHPATSGRLPLPDILKGIAVFRMVVVHLMEVFATAEIYESLTGKLLVFLAGPPGAPLFMAIMGYYIALSAKELKDGISRGLKLIVWGLFLNLGMNFHLLLKIAFGSLQLNPWPYIFGVDILFLAGFSLIVISVCKRLFKSRILPFLLLFVLFTAMTPIMLNIHAESIWLRYVLAFFWSDETWSYFPLFPWMAYPLAGYIFYLLDQKYRLTDFSNRGLTYVALSLFFILLLTFNRGFAIATNMKLYYHHSFIFSIWILVMITFWVIIIHLATRKITEMRIIRYFRWVGRHVTNFYVFQWLLIGNIGTVVYKTQHEFALIAWFISIILSTSILVFLYNQLKQRLRPK